MKINVLLTCLSLLLPSVASAAHSVIDKGLENRMQSDPLSRKYITPLRLVALPDSLTAGVENPEALLSPFDGQVAVSSGNQCVLSTEGGKAASILLDFGKELTGSVEIAAPIRPDKRAVNVRIRLGESVSEAMSDVNDPETTATNDHSLRDFIVPLPWLGTLEVGNSGFRFVRVDLADPDATLPLRAVRAVLRYRDIPYLGSFRCSDPRLNDIWETGAYTVHLNMQNYLWDGVKRDRLVWVGDMHPEVMTIAEVFADYDVVRKSLDFARDTSPLPGWMNDIAAYSMWWVLIHRDLYMHTADLGYLRQQQPYMQRLFAVLADGLDGDKENLQGGQRLLDWPTSRRPEVIHAGYQALMAMTMEAGQQIARWIGDSAMERMCAETLTRLRRYHPADGGAKQAAAMLILSGLSQNPQKHASLIAEGGAQGFSTFFGYYMLEALAAAGRYDEAIGIISDYWGAMLDLGATTFWEDLDYSEALRAARIDQPVPEGQFDIHASSGDHCYVGHRHSYCHGWASGPTPWLSRHVLGVQPLAPGFAEISVKPNLGSLDWAEGTVPTPYGIITVRHTRRPDGTVDTTVDAPPQIRVR